MIRTSPSTRVLTIATVGILALTSCGDEGGEASEEPVEGGTLVYATDVQPAAGGLDPYVSIAFASQNVTVQAYESLLTKDDDGEIQPWLAESWDQIDETTVQVTLRDDVQFADGSDLTVDDVVFSFEQMTDPSAPQAARLQGLTEIEAIDDLTVEFRFDNPNGAFLNVISAQGTAFIVSEEWYTSTSDDDRQRETMGTGPFTVESWEDNVSVNLVANEHYWREDLPYLDAIEFQILGSETSRQSAIRGSDVQAGWMRDAQLTAQLEDEGYNVGANAATRGLHLYVNGTEGPLADVEVRQAINLATDYDEIVNFYDGEGEVSLFVPIGDPNAIPPSDDTPGYTHDVDAAIELLEEAGYQDGVTVSLTYASDDAFALDVPAYEVMREQLSEAGIDLQLEGAAWADVVASFNSGDWSDLIAVPGIYQPDPTAYLTAFLSEAPTNRVTEPDDPGRAEMEELFRLTDPDDREEKLAEILDIVHDQAYVYTLYAEPQRREVWGDELQGYSVDPYTYRSRLAEAWIDQ